MIFSSRFISLISGDGTHDNRFARTKATNILVMPLLGLAAMIYYDKKISKDRENQSGNQSRPRDIRSGGVDKSVGPKTAEDKKSRVVGPFYPEHVGFGLNRRQSNCIQ